VCDADTYFDVGDTLHVMSLSRDTFSKGRGILD
jgi:hypothetical protein